MIDRTANGKAFKILNIIDEYTRECLATLVDRKIKADDVINQLFNLFVFRGIPEHIRSDNGPEFTAKAVRKWLQRLEVKTLFIEPGSPWENGYIESFNGKMRDELLNVIIHLLLLSKHGFIYNLLAHYGRANLKYYQSLDHWQIANLENKYRWQPLYTMIVVEFITLFAFWTEVGIIEKFQSGLEVLKRCFQCSQRDRRRS